MNKIKKIMNKLGFTGLMIALLFSVSCECQNFFWSHSNSQFTAVKYGYLYNYYAATDAREILAVGWHLPSLTEITDMQTYIANNGYTSTTDGAPLKEIGTTYWLTPNTGADNSFRFNGRGAGERRLVFQNFNASLLFWATTLAFAGNNRVGRLYYNNQNYDYGYNQWMNGLPIRPLKDSTTLSHGETGTYTGNDGKVYRTICIGTQEWLADNLAETKYANGDWITGFDGGTYTPISNAVWAALTTEAMCAYDNDESNVLQ